MSLCRTVATLLSLLLVCIALTANEVNAQTSTDAPAAAPQNQAPEDVDLDTQLYLLIATNQDVDDTKLPPVLEPIVKRLRTSLPFKNYRLAATFINRVKNEGRLQLKWVGDSMFTSPAPLSGTPSFNEFSVNGVKLMRDAAGKEYVRMETFRFGARIPIQSVPVASTANTPPIINYEPTGLTTDISIRAGEPAVVGTLNVGPSGDAIILVISAKRASQ